jgi:hypothetical protein
MPTLSFRSTRVLAVLCAAGMAFGVAACGDDSGSGDSPSDVALNFYKALADKDSGKACDYLSDKAAKSAEGAGGCEKALDATIKETKPALLEAFGSLEASNEKIDGDKATVTLTPTARGYTSGHQEANLVKQDGDWKIDDFNAG